MQTNLVMATALFCGIAGASLALTAQAALWRTRQGAVLAYPRVLARLHARRLDRRFGSYLAALAAPLYAAASYGFSAPLSLWRYPAAVIGALTALYVLRRLSVLYRRVAPQGGVVRTLYETPRTRTLRQAAITESAALRALEASRDPRDTGIVFLAREWDRRWWASRLGTSVEAIRDAIREVGPMVKDIERHLGRQALAA